MIDLLGASQASELSFSDFAAIAGVVVGIVGVLMTPLWVLLRRAQAESARARERLDAALAEHQASRRVEAVAWRSHALALRSISSAFESTAGLLHRLLVGRANEINSDEAIVQFHAIKTGVDRAAAEAALLSGIEERQISALQQLVHRLGDVDTLGLLNEAARAGTIGILTTADFDQAARQLASRLTERPAVLPSLGDA